MAQQDHKHSLSPGQPWICVQLTQGRQRRKSSSAYVLTQRSFVFPLSALHPPLKTKHSSPGKEFYLVLPGFFRNLTDAVFLCSFVTCHIMQNMLGCKIRASIVSKMLSAFFSCADLEVRALQGTLGCVCSL